MNTGITTLTNLPEVKAVYPFAGMEVPFTIGFVALFLVFLGWQFVMEAKHHKAIIGTFTASPAE
ncbi:MAG: hypothetical protein IKE66_02190 [Hyphomicrobium sp.]|nr:hypothetical protein [Hyphomicrobium sp.]